MLPVIQIFWSNTHIYFALGPGILFLFLIDRWVHEKDKKLIKKIGLIFLITSFATLVNPNFIKGALLPFNILKNYGYTIVENQSIFFLKDYGILLGNIRFFEISLVILIISFVIAIRGGARKITFEILAAVIFSILGIKMIRNLGIYSLVFVPIVALNLSYWQPPKWLNKKFTKTAGYIIFTILIMFLAISTVNNNYYRWIKSPKKFGLIIPAGAESGVKFVKENGIMGPVFNNFDIGSFLIWKMYPEEKVFIDGRPEAYTVEFFEKIYKPMQENPALWDKYSEQYGINYIFWNHHDITPWSQKFLNYISQNQNWPLVYADNSVVIFLKRTPGNEEIINKKFLNQL